MIHPALLQGSWRPLGASSGGLITDGARVLLRRGLMAARPFSSTERGCVRKRDCRERAAPTREAV
jgi:hypothetical protein